MSVLESRVPSQFTFPPPATKDEEQQKDVNFEPEETTSSSEIQQHNSSNPSSVRSSTVLSDNNNTETKHSVSSSINNIQTTPIGTPGKSAKLLTIPSLIETEIFYQSQVDNAQHITNQILRLLTYYNVLNRLHCCLTDFFDTLSEKSRLEPHKFSTYFHYCVEFYKSIITDHNVSLSENTLSSPFGLHLKTAHQNLLNSFLTLIKSSPTFIASCLLSMPYADLCNFTNHSLDPFEDLSSLYRSNPLDILFHGFFPQEVPLMQRLEYFSQICALLIDAKKGEKIYFEIFDKIMNMSGHPFKSSLEQLILDLLQEGSFLTLPGSVYNQTATTAAKKRSPSTTSSILTNVPSPEMPNATLFNGSESSHQQYPKKPGSIHTNSSSSLSSIYWSNENKTLDFHQRSIQQVVQFLDKSSIDSIPQSFLTFCRLILSKISPKNKNSALHTIMVKYLFNRHLSKLLTTPENFGILKNCFINDIQRQRILIPIFQKTYKLVASILLEDNPHHSYEFDIDFKSHLDSIINKVSSAPPESTPSEFDLDSKFGPMGNLTQADFYSPGQTFVLSPSDVVKIYSALFPSYSNNNSNNNNNNNNNSDSSIPSNNKPVNMDQQQQTYNNNYAPFPFSEPGYSTTATSFVSTQSSTNENLPSLTELVHQVNHKYNCPNDDGDVAVMDDSDNESCCESPLNYSPRVSESYEWSLDDIKTDLEPVMDDLIKKFPYLQLKSNPYLNSLRPSKLNNFKLPHPMNESWQVFRVNEQGEIDSVTSSSILDQARANKATSMLNDDSNNNEEIYSATPIAPANRGIANIVKRAIEKVILGAASSIYEDTEVYESISSYPNGYTYSLLSNALERETAKENFLEANEYTNALNALKKLLPQPTSSSYKSMALSVNNYLVSLIQKEKEQNNAKVQHQIEVAETYSKPYKLHLRRVKKRCNEIFTNLHDIRTKVWYVTEIRPSPLWNRAKDVARALTQGSQGEANNGNNNNNSNSMDLSSPTNTFQGLRRNNSTSSLSSGGGVFSFRRFTGSSKRDYNRRQSLMNSLVPQSDGMFAPKEYAGEYKLSDRETASTKKWLHGQKIQNLCTGEERIHRFCCEIDDLIKRIMGDVLSNRRNRGHSLLTSSGLFKPDLWKLIVEVEGVDRSSTPSLQRSSTFHTNNTNSTNEFEYQFGRPGDLMSKDTNSRQSMVDKTGSLRTSTHRSQRSSPNLLDMFSSLDISSRRGSEDNLSPHDSGFESTSTSFHKQGNSSSSVPNNHHRRNKSLNDTKVGTQDNNNNNNSEDSYFNFSSVYPQDSSTTTTEVETKRQELDGFILDLQMRLTGMIYSDIGMGCWFEGSETDQWINAPVVEASVERAAEQKRKMKQAVSGNAHAQTAVFKLSEPPMGDRTSKRHSRKHSQLAPGDFPSSTGPEPHEGTSFDHSSKEGSRNNAATSQGVSFDYDQAYKQILRRLSVATSPIEKLNTLYSLEMLVVSALSNNGGVGGLQTPNSIRSNHRSNMASMSSEVPTPLLNSPGIPNRSSMNNGANKKGVAAAIKTSLGESIASAEARRCSSSMAVGQNPFFAKQLGPNTDTIAEELRRIFTTSGVKSKTLFRDLQIISAFVPAQVLDLTDIGKAFWDVSLAALSMKEETISTIVECASEIFQYNSGMITQGEVDHQFLSQWGLADCAWLWSVASKEGDTVGQRELAIMHMSHPQIAPICLMPFSKIQDTFSSTLLEDSRVMEDLDKYDPIRMAIIKHWMTHASNQGDNIATEYLMQQSPSGYI